jgi:hypothetical protein
MTIELIDESDDLGTLGGMVGAINQFDVTPRINPARVRPFVWSVLLLRSAVRIEEIVSSISPHAHPDDLRSWEQEEATLNCTVRATLDEMVQHNILRLGREGLYVLSNAPEASRRAISVTSTVNGQLPDHMLAEMGRTHYALNQ